MQSKSKPTIYSDGLSNHIPTPRRPLLFCYESTGTEIRFTNLLEADARSRSVFAFHKPETFSQWIQAVLKSPGSTVRGKIRTMPPLDQRGLWPAQTDLRRAGRFVMFFEHAFYDMRFSPRDRKRA